MKHLFKILLALIFFSLINLGYAATSRSYAVNVTIKNGSSAPLYYQNWQPVHPGVTVSLGALTTNTPISSLTTQTFPLTLKGMPGQLPQIMLTLGYDQTDSNNSCTTRIRPLSSGFIPTQRQGMVACKASGVTSQGTTNITVKMMRPRAQCALDKSWHYNGGMGKGSDCVHGDFFCHTFKASCAWNNLICIIYTRIAGPLSSCRGGPEGYVIFQDGLGKHIGNQQQHTANCLGGSWSMWGTTVGGPLPKPSAIRAMCASAVQNDTYLNQYYGN